MENIDIIVEDRVIEVVVDGGRGPKGDGIINIKTTLDFDTIDLSKADTGVSIHTSGFSSPNDGGAASYVISTGLTENGIDIFSLTDGRFAKLNINEDRTINVLQLGAKGDNTTNNTPIFTRAIDILMNGGELIFPKGIYRTLEPIIVKYGNTSLTSFGATIKPLTNWNQKLYLSENLKGIISVFGSSSQNIFNVEIKGFTCDGSDFAGNPFSSQVAQNGIDTYYAETVRILNNKVVGIENYGIWFANGRDAILDGNTVNGAAESFEIAQSVEDVVCSNNYAFGTSITLNHYLIYGDATNIKILNCTAKGNGAGINISTSNGGCSNVIIENCNIEVSSASGSISGIIVDGSELYPNTDVRISNSYVKVTDNLGSCIRFIGNEIITNVIIENNQLSCPSYLGFLIDAAVGSKNIKISNNIIESQDGNSINNFTNLVFENNLVICTDLGGQQYDNVAGNMYQNNRFINSPIINPSQKTILVSNEFIGSGNNAINIGASSYVFNNLGLQTNLVTGANSVLINNHFQAYFGSGNSIRITANELRYSFPNIYFDSLQTITGATSTNAQTNAVAAGVNANSLYKWDDGNAIHLMIRK